ncbi:LLM class flavin-dependent oxidoreductase [Saccharopolyspora phatthalungensis]|nr:LLM class flavin-dependent oxidoreductase [Saccharopolyspora phatthalungensis]
MASLGLLGAGCAGKPNLDPARNRYKALPRVTAWSNANAALVDAAQIPSLDPFLVVPAMANVTNNFGFGVTESVTYQHPYALARRFTTLDHLTSGRVGWNLVTSYSDSEARNLGTGI